MPKLTKNEIRESIEIFYSPFEDTEEAIIMINEMDINLLSNDVAKEMYNYFLESSEKINEKSSKSLVEWKEKAILACKSMKIIKKHLFA